MKILIVPQAGQTTDQLFDFETGERMIIKLDIIGLMIMFRLLSQLKFDVKVLYKKGIKKKVR